MVYDPWQIAVITGLLGAWNLAVIHYISRIFHDLATRWENIPAQYVGRKAVHALGAGVTALLIPIFFEGYYWVVVGAALLFAAYIQVRRIRAPLRSFQIEENAYEVHFAIAYGAILGAGVLLGNVWIGLIPMLFMSFGDSATGLVRAYTQRDHVKSWDGTVAMFGVCSLIAYPILGWYGIPLAAAASLIERLPNIDDNITVPILSAAILYFLPLS